MYNFIKVCEKKASFTKNVDLLPEDEVLTKIGSYRKINLETSDWRSIGT